MKPSLRPFLFVFGNRAMANPSPRTPLSGRSAEHRSSLARWDVLTPLQSFTIGRPTLSSQPQMMRKFCQIFGSVYPLRGAVRVTVRARVYNLRPITPYLDENLTSPSNTLFLSMINDQISRLKNTFLLPKGEMPNYSHLERPSSQN
jgi:hypothetical protein